MWHCIKLTFLVVRCYHSPGWFCIFIFSMTITCIDKIEITKNFVCAIIRMAMLFFKLQWSKLKYDKSSVVVTWCLESAFLLLLFIHLLCSCHVYLVRILVFTVFLCVCIVYTTAVSCVEEGREVCVRITALIWAGELV